MEQTSNHASAPPNAEELVEETVVRPRRIWHPPASARCAACGGANLAGLPTYSVGSGVALRPQADDALCRDCGEIGPPEYGAAKE